MDQKIMFLCTILSFSLFFLFKTIKNKPEYLLLLGIRGLFSILFIQLINRLCLLLHLTTVVAVNPLSTLVGAFLGIPGIILLHAAGIFLF